MILDYVNNNEKMPVWVTVNEAVDIINNSTTLKLNVSDIYRHVLYGNIRLSIYFQSPVKLRKVSLINGSIKLKKCEDDLIRRLCCLNKVCFLNEEINIIETEGDFIPPSHYVVDTPLIGHEHAALQILLANSLDIPPPAIGQYNISAGVLVIHNNVLYQVYETCTWEMRLEKQIQLLPTSKSSELYGKIAAQQNIKNNKTDYFPINYFPDDACFVIKKLELDRFITTFPTAASCSPALQTRISTPVSRLLWLACKNNENISSLIEQPYKLLSIFEEWAACEGLTDRLSGETLKTALERGSPISATTSV
ncbi:TPA: hypothetical protein JAN03_24390 [Citrobacter freundii]|nr:hypothetical protein [Citrobacter freundii]